ncbi:DNA cytosine methyltransferase [Streptomyces sp. NPDC051561]|uniref:DNA cytosine methyltransferase n=1 Tax=Streptomyces sp. NPDC051561 TaxID=3365658 RepID=UPI00378DE481
MTARRRRPKFDEPLISVEICAGAGGQALGLHNAGFDHAALVEWDGNAVATLKKNIGTWNGWDKRKIDALEPGDVRDFLKSPGYEVLKNGKRVDLLAGGVPCPPFSLAGKQLGPEDERDLFPEMLEIVEDLRPRAIMIENVRGILEPPEVFIDYRRMIVNKLHGFGYDVPLIDERWSVSRQNEEMKRVWRRVDAKYFDVPQLRPRAILVAVHKDVEKSENFSWPLKDLRGTSTVLDKLHTSMLKRCKEYWNLNSRGEPASAGEKSGQDVYQGWHGKALDALKGTAGGVAPTLVGGSRKHGGADLGPTRAKKAWAVLGVDGNGVANDSTECDPGRDLFRPDGPMLTVEQAAIIQGFPPKWKFQGRKTAQYRQVGNAFPPPVAEAIGRAIVATLRPEVRSEVLKDYSMEEGFVVEVRSEQSELPFSLSESEVSPTDHCRGDLVGA